jgi:hypothetical protein
VYGNHFALLSNKVQDFILHRQSVLPDICLFTQKNQQVEISSLRKTQDASQDTRPLWPVSSKYIYRCTGYRRGDRYERGQLMRAGNECKTTKGNKDLLGVCFLFLQALLGKCFGSHLLLASIYRVYHL